VRRFTETFESDVPGFEFPREIFARKCKIFGQGPGDATGLLPRIPRDDARILRAQRGEQRSVGVVPGYRQDGYALYRAFGLELACKLLRNVAGGTCDPALEGGIAPDRLPQPAYDVPGVEL
jgi:hypothetical protein